MRIINLLLICLLVSCSNYNSSNTTTIIKGKIENIDTNTRHFLSLTYIVYGGQETEYTPIDKNGSFRFEIDLHHPINYRFKYDDSWIRLYSEPRDSLKLVFDSNAFRESIKVSGDNQEFNQSYLQFQSESPKYFRNYILGVDSASMISSQALKHYVISTIERNEQYMEDFAKRYNCSKKFYDWALNHMNYEITYDLTWYPGEKDDSFYDFYETFELNNPSAIDCYRYWIYLQEYLVHLIKTKCNLSQDSISLSILNQFITDNTTGPGRDFLLALNYLWITEGPSITVDELNQESAKYIEKIKSNKIKNYLSSYFEDYIRTIGDNISAFDIESLELSSDLTHFFKDRTGRSIYAKVWGNWCGSCVSSMPEFLTLKQKYKNVDFVLLAIDSHKRSVDKILSNLGISEDCYFLDNNQSLELKEIFEIEALPHYFLIDSIGNIVKRNAPHPKSIAIEEMLKTLN